jgi:phenylacetate-coenzyme A ligase PaaK-like adenylate-forming protein
MSAGRPALSRTPLEQWVLRRAGASDLEGLRRHQLRALRETVARARERSSFYAGRLAAVGPGDIASLDDVARLPFTTADDVRREGMRLLCVSPGEVARIVTLPTSGTTGEPKRIHFSAADQELTIDFFQHGMAVLAGPADRVLILLPGERPGSVGELLARGLARLGATPLPYGPVRDSGDALDTLERERASVVVGIPVQVLALARRDVAQGRRLRLRSVLLSTDHLPRPIVSAIERAWGCRVFDHYGTTETGLGGGVECDAHAGLHLREADLLFEVVDPRTGVPLPPGGEGEVVFTTLTREAMPLIRYRTGDIGRFLAGPCPCGSSLRLLAGVRGRFDGVAALAGGERLCLADLDEALFALDGVVDVRARLLMDGGGEVLEVELALEGGGAEGGGEAADSRAEGGGGAALQLRAAAALERTAALAAACAAGRLRITVSVAERPRLGTDGTAKRRLLDERPRERS